MMPAEFENTENSDQFCKEVGRLVDVMHEATSLIEAKRNGTSLPETPKLDEFMAETASDDSSRRQNLIKATSDFVNSL